MTVIVFLLLAFIPLVADMYVHRLMKGKTSLASASIWSAVYVAAALTFAGYLYLTGGSEPASLFLTGYALEKTLSVDNLMIFSVIFVYFGVRGADQHRVLHWGILGSVILRLIFVAVGVGVFAVFGRLIEIVFGVFVLWSALKFSAESTDDGEPIDHDSRWYIRLTRKFLHVATDAQGCFFTLKNGWIPAVTPLFLCLIAIECTDIAFAFDSVPAVVAVTREPVLIYASIMFAVLGLRSLYFVLDALKQYLVYLQKAILVVLVFIGFKLLLHGVLGWEISPKTSLIIVLGTIGIGVAASLGHGKEETL